MTPLRPVQSPLLVGRDDLLARADVWLSDVGSSHGHTLLLAGSAGIGKSRLLRAIARKAVAAGMRSQGGALAPQDQDVPLASILDLARTIRSHAAFGTLGGDLLAIRERSRMEGNGMRRTLVHDVVDRLLQGIDRPTMLAFEDLQWADELSLQAIGELARKGADRPLLVVGTYRGDELPAGGTLREWRTRLVTQRVAEEVALRPLTYEETALVVTLILGSGLPAPSDVVQAVWSRTDGIPLHVEELLAALDDEARTDGRRIREAHVPATIEDAVRSRLGRLSPGARSVARAGAVIGRSFVPDVVAGMLDRSLDELDDPLEELVEASVLHPFGERDGGYYDFRHQALRDVAYATVPAGELRRLHARAAEFASSLDGHSVVHASVHYERAGLGTQAFRTALAAGREANAISSRREAFELYRRAIANVPDDLDPLELAELWSGYVNAAAALDDSETCRVASEEARRQYLAAGRTAQAADMLLNVAVMRIREVEPGWSDLVAEAAAEIDTLPDGPERDRGLADVRSMGVARMLGRVHLDELELAFAALTTGVDPDAVGTDGLETETLGATIDVLRGRVDEGLATLRRVAATAESQQLEDTCVGAYRDLARYGARAMRYQDAADGLREGMRYGGTIEQSYCLGIMAAASALVAWARGDWDGAANEAARRLVEPGSRRARFGSMDVLGFVAIGRGTTARARQLLEESLAAATLVDEIAGMLPPLWGLAEADLVDGDPAAALARCEDALARALETDERALLVPFVVTAVRAAIAARRPERAEWWVETLMPELAAWQWTAAPALDHAVGLLRTSTGSTIVAREALERAVAGWDERGRAWEAAWARLDLAACLLRANRDAEAMETLGEALARATALDSPPLARRAEELLAIGRSRGAETEPWRPLTAREFEVARLVAEGMTNASIASALGLSPRTVGAHVEHILAKLQFTRRAEIAAWVAGMGAPLSAVAR